MRRVEPGAVDGVLAGLKDPRHPDPAGMLDRVAREAVETVAAYLHFQVAGS